MKNKQPKSKISYSKMYELFCLSFGLGAVLTFTFFLITKYPYPIIFTEPYFSIRLPEVLIGIFITPYYIKKLNNTAKNISK